MNYSKLSHDALLDIAQDELDMFTLPHDWREGREQVEGYAIDESYVCDVDDAVLATPGAEGATMLTVSIADTASFLSQPSAIRTLARRKAWTKYRRNLAANPMLPPEISEDILSLHDGKERPVIAVRIPVNKYGALEAPTIARAIISAKRFSPEHVSAALCEPEISTDADSLAIRSLRRLAQRLHHDRAQHSHRFEGGSMRTGGRASWASFIVEETMIAANRSIANYMHDNEIPGLFRIFEGVGLAQYSSQPEPHQALGLPLYTHSTSPLRRFPDFVNQANILAFQDGKRLPFSANKLDRMTARMNEIQADEATRTIHKYSPRIHKKPQLKKEKGDAIQCKLEGAVVKPADIVSGLFYDDPDPNITYAIRAQAMKRLAEDPIEARQVINIAANRKIITVRPRKPEDQAYGHTEEVVVDAAGNVYAYAKTSHKSKQGTNGRYAKAHNAPSQRRKQIAQDMALLSSITGIEVRPIWPLEMQEGIEEQVRKARHLLSEINANQPCALQYSYGRTPGGGYVVTVYIKVDGEVQSATATRKSKDTASSVAAYELVSRYNLFDTNSRTALNLRKSGDRKKSNRKTAEGHSPQHYLHQYLMKEVGIAPQYIVTTYETEDGVHSTDCTVFYQDKEERKHITCVSTSSRKKSKALVAKYALRALKAPIVNKFDELSV